MAMFKKLLKQLNRDKVRRGDEYEIELSSKMSITVETIQNIVGESDDVIHREIKIGHKIPATLFYIESLCDRLTLEEYVLKPLLHLPAKDAPAVITDRFITSLQEEILTLAEIRVLDSIDNAILQFMSGKTLMVIDGLKRLIILNTIGYEDRAIEEPESEVVIRGPRDGLNENLKTNMMLLRRKIRDPNLTIQVGSLGRRGKRPFAICYMKGIANEQLVEEVRYRISCVDTDDVPATGSLEEYIQDDVLSPFPQLFHTERPDNCVRGLLNGNVIILLEGTPFALMAPVTFHQLLISSEDFYERWLLATLIRILRYAASFIALFLPALYIAMNSFHQGMIPTTLALSIAGSREGVPFPSFVEALIMEATFELLREAGIRLPRHVGQTIGVVGGLIIGEAAVRAGIVSPIMVIVVALTAISNFAIPGFTVAISFRMLRFALMVAAAIFGLYGVIIAYIAVNIHLVGLRSMGSYYLSPFSPYSLQGIKDSIIRLPLNVLRRRKAEPRTLDDWREPRK